MAVVHEVSFAPRNDDDDDDDDDDNDDDALERYTIFTYINLCVYLYIPQI
jgi:hypothetical protein